LRPNPRKTIWELAFWKKKRPGDKGRGSTWFKKTANTGGGRRANNQTHYRAKATGDGSLISNIEVVRSKTEKNAGRIWRKKSDTRRRPKERRGRIMQFLGKGSRGS